MLLCGSLAKSFDPQGDCIYPGGCAGHVSDPYQKCPDCGYIFPDEFKQKFGQWVRDYGTKSLHDYLNTSHSKFLFKHLQTSQNIPLPVTKEILLYLKFHSNVIHHYLTLKQFQTYFYNQTKRDHTPHAIIKMAQFNPLQAANIDAQFGSIILFHEPQWKYNPPHYNEMTELEDTETDEQDVQQTIFPYIIDTKSQSFIATFEIHNEDDDYFCDFSYTGIPIQISKHFNDSISFFQFFHPKKQWNLQWINLKWNDVYLQQICGYNEIENKQYFDILHPSKCQFTVRQIWVGLIMDVKFEEDYISDIELSIPFQCSWKYIVEYYEYEYKMHEIGEKQIVDGFESEKIIRKGETTIEFAAILRNENFTQFGMIPVADHLMSQHLSPIWRHFSYTGSEIRAGPIKQLKQFKQQIMALNGHKWLPHSFDDRINWFIKDKWYIMIAYNPYSCDKKSGKSTNTACADQNNFINVTQQYVRIMSEIQKCFENMAFKKKTKRLGFAVSNDEESNEDDDINDEPSLKRRKH